jgi:hypothetical protein
LRTEARHIGKVEKARIPLDWTVRQVPLHHTFQIVIEQTARESTQLGKGMHMAANEPGKVEGSGKAQVHRSRPREGEHKSVELTEPARISDQAEVAPIDLSLQPRRRLETNGGGGGPWWSAIVDKGSNLGLSTWIALGNNLPIELVC